MGTANFAGPWGSTLNTSSSGQLTFNRLSSAKYLLLTETSSNGSNDTYQATVSCASPSSSTVSFGGVSIIYYPGTKLLQFNSPSQVEVVLNKLESDYETYNTNYENQFPTFTADQLDIQDSLSNFNEWQTVNNFESLFPSFVSKRSYLYTLETNWLNTTSDLSESTDPDSLDYSSDYFSNTIANQNDKLIIGTSTYQYTLNGLLVNGVKSEEEGSGSIVFPQFAATSSSTVFCQYCDTCRNWQRSWNWSVQFADDNGRRWKFKKVIAIRGVSIEGKGHVRATVKGRKLVGSKWKRKRANLRVYMVGKVYSNKCTQETPFNSGIFQSSRPRIWMSKRFGPVGSRFFRTKKLKITGGYEINPKNTGTWIVDVLNLTW